MNKIIIESTDLYELNKITGYTKFSGCQCFGDCSCAEDFKSQYFEVYNVIKKVGKINSKRYGTIEEAQQRIEFLNQWLIDNPQFSPSPMTK